MRMLEVHAWRLAQRALYCGKRRTVGLRWGIKGISKRRIRIYVTSEQLDIRKL